MFVHKDIIIVFIFILPDSSTHTTLGKVPVDTHVVDPKEVDLLKMWFYLDLFVLFRCVYRLHAHDMLWDHINVSE